MASSASRKDETLLARSASGTLRQAFCASRAALTAASMAASDMMGRRTSSRPSMGEMQTISVSAMMMLLDDLEIAGELPVGDGFAGLPLFPFARRGVMVNESIAEKLARCLRRFKPPGGFPERPRQSALLRVLYRIGV